MKKKSIPRLHLEDQYASAVQDTIALAEKLGPYCGDSLTEYTSLLQAALSSESQMLRLILLVTAPDEEQEQLPE